MCLSSEITKRCNNWLISVPTLQIAYIGLQLIIAIHVSSEFKGYGFEIKKLKSVEISFPLRLPKLQQAVKHTQKMAAVKSC